MALTQLAAHHVIDDGASETELLHVARGAWKRAAESRGATEDEPRLAVVPGATGYVARILRGEKLSDEERADLRRQCDKRAQEVEAALAEFLKISNFLVDKGSDDLSIIKALMCAAAYRMSDHPHLKGAQGEFLMQSMSEAAWERAARPRELPDCSPRPQP
jgi:hypothetical protein